MLKIKRLKILPSKVLFIKMFELEKFFIAWLKNYLTIYKNK